MTANDIKQIVLAVLDAMGLVPKPAAPASSKRVGRVDGMQPKRELTELEKVQRDFQWQREHGGLYAEGRMNQYGTIEWRRYR